MKFYQFARIAPAIVLSLFFGDVLAGAQSRSTPPASAPQQSDGEDERFGSPVREMASRSYFARLEAEHQENIRRAGEAAALASELLRSYTEDRALSPVDVKNLERLEKIARRLRGYAGGSDDDAAEPAAATSLGESLAQIAELSSALQREVEQTPRRIVSAKLISDANRVLDLIRQARSLARQ